MAWQTSHSLWVYPRKNPEWHKRIVKEFNIHPVIAQILISRGFATLEEIHKYLYATLPNLYDPSLFIEMDKGVNRVLTALEKKEGILIYGDNDVDGMSAAALLVDFFKTLGANVFYFIPESISNKKDVIADALQFAIKNRCALIITVDYGTTAANEISHIATHNIDVIITDHHEPTSKIPNCIAILNPKLINSTYPNRDITGVGVAFKLAHAITNALSEKGAEIAKSIDLKSYLDLVALGTISDMGALRGENRILVRYGLEELKKTHRIGLKKLFEICDLKMDHLSCMDIASKVAPRLNSLGRIADPKKGVELLLIKNENEAGRLANELDLYNIERQKIERKASDDIAQYIENHPKLLNEKAIVLYSNKWHPGVIPIITARIAKQYNRPTMLISIDNKVGKGSIRTVHQFPLLSTLKENENLLINFGGHDFAAGLTVREENIPQLKKAFIKSANESLKKRDLISKIYLDAVIKFTDLTFDFMESIQLLEPYGNENPPPLLYTDAKQTWIPKLIGKMHLKMFLEQNEMTLEGLGFGLSHRIMQLKQKNLILRIAFTPTLNTYLNKTSIQLQIKDFKVRRDLKKRTVR